MDDCVKRYKQRRDERLKARKVCCADSKEKEWTVPGEKWTEQGIKDYEEKYGRKPVLM